MDITPIQRVANRVATRLRGTFEVALLILTCLLMPQVAVAQSTYYWDSNGVASGTGTAPSGTWGISPFWSTSITGVAATSYIPTTIFDTLTFSAGTSATGSYTITVDNTQYARRFTVDDGTVLFNGGTIVLGGPNNAGIIVSNSAGNVTVSSNLNVSGNITIFVAAGRTLALETGTFTRTAAAVLNLQSTGTLTSTMSGFSGNNTTGIIGAWATVGTFTSAKYATFSGSNVVGYTGTAAANAAALTDTTGLVNYDLASASGTMPATVSANTIRFTGTGASMPLGTSFTVNGLLNAGPSGAPWVLTSNTLTIGAEKELVLHANASISIASVIQDNGSGASGLTVSAGSSVALLSGANTYTGPTNISGGVLQIGATGLTGSISPSSAIINNGFLHFGRTNTLTQGTDFASVISGAGAVRQLVAGTTILNGMNIYTGATSITNGLLSVSNIGDGGVASNIGASSNANANLVIGSGAFSCTLQYTGATASTDRGFTLASGGTGTISITNSNTNLTFSGASATTTGSLLKTGAGALTLSGNNAYTGTTSINAGTLNINGDQSLANGNVTVGGASATGTPTLGGTGTVGGNVLVSAASGGAAGTIRPGAGAIGNLTVNAGVTFNQGSILSILLGTNSGAISSSLTITGTARVLDLSQGGLSRVSLRPGGFNREAGFVDYTLALLPTDGVIQVNSVPTTGILSTYTVGSGNDGTVLIDPATLTGLQEGDRFVLYQDQDALHNTLHVAFYPVPEPTLMLGLAAMSLACANLRRRRTSMADPHGSCVFCINPHSFGRTVISQFARKLEARAA